MLALCFRADVFFRRQGRRRCSRAADGRGGLAPSDKITIGVIGWGMMGPANTKAFLTTDDCQVVAACELDGKNMQDGARDDQRALRKQGLQGVPRLSGDAGADDIDAIMIAVPDHWHAMIATEAAKRKKDIYGEKPLARTIFEQQAIVRAVEKNNVIWQTGSWQRSLPSFHKAAEIVRNGLIGDVTHVEVGLPGGHHDFPGHSAGADEEAGVAAEPAGQPCADCAGNAGVGSGGVGSAGGFRL